MTRSFKNILPILTGLTLFAALPAFAEFTKVSKAVEYPRPIEGKGKVSNCADADTLYVSIPVRLLYVDRHETSYNPRADFQAQQEGITLEEVYAKGKVQKDYVDKIIKENKGENVRFVLHGRDKYGRQLGEIFIGNNKRSLNQELLDEGICPAYKSRR
ncbi:hypothetical protein tpqmel_0551 [Candidatus Gastranaerophilus sp. (ex Termes propinquus)]|nr:hypothetical protein tpqmel_0551 [Candidatus Gastranaerophilus sp. (ex Termes propinquus)]